MASPARMEANRLNTLKSTGPKTAKGKSVVARNAVKHGLLSREVLLPDENRSTFRSFAVSLCEELQPEGALEIMLADRIISAAWRLRRIQIIETDLCELDQGRYQSAGTRFIQDCFGSQAFVKLARYETTIERSLYRALRELERLQAKRASENRATPIDVSAYLPPGSP